MLMDNLLLKIYGNHKWFDDFVTHINKFGNYKKSEKNIYIIDNF